MQVARDSPGAVAGIHEGDVIRAIDGHSAAELSYADVFDLLRGAPGTPISFDVVRGAQKLRTVVVLQIPRLSE